MQKAMQGRRGHIAVIEILIAIGVFLVSSLVMGVVQVPLMMMELMTNQEYMDLIMQGDMESFQAAAAIASNIPEWMMIVTLLTEILMILVVILYCRFFEKRNIETMGFCKKGMVGQYALGLLGGFLFFTVAYLLCVLTGSIHFEGLAKEIAPLYIVGYLAGYLVQGMAEEVLCRGYLFVSLTRRHSLRYSIVLSAVFFTVLHGINPGLSVIAVWNLFLFGVFAALLLVKYENIWIVGAFHSIWNFVQGNLYGIQVSGNPLQQSVFASTCKSSLSVINGGAFGMEGGLAVTLVLGAGIAYLVWVLKKEGKIIEQNVAPLYSGGSFPQNGHTSGNGTTPPTGSMPAHGNFPQAGNTFQNGNVPPAGNMPSHGSYPQTGDTFHNENVPSAGNMPTNSVLPNENSSKAQPKRENMGVAPNETPWHPDQAEKGAPDATGSQENVFNADYFKE